MTTETPTMTRIYGKPMPAAPGVGPVQYELLPNKFKRMDPKPVRRLRDGLSFVFEAPGWQEILLFNFHLARQWPNEEVEWLDHEPPKNLDAFHRCMRSGDRFTWATTEKTKLPQDIVNYVQEFIDDDEYAILKFDVLAKKENGEWFMVDPGTGIKP